MKTVTLNCYNVKTKRLCVDSGNFKNTLSVLSLFTYNFNFAPKE